MPFFVHPGELFCFNNHHEEYVEDFIVAYGGASKGGKCDAAVHMFLSCVSFVSNIPCRFHAILVGLYLALVILTNYFVKILNNFPGLLIGSLMSVLSYPFALKASEFRSKDILN